MAPYSWNYSNNLARNVETLYNVFAFFSQSCFSPILLTCHFSVHTLTSDEILNYTKTSHTSVPNPSPARDCWNLTFPERSTDVPQASKRDTMQHRSPERAQAPTNLRTIPPSYHAGGFGVTVECTLILQTVIWRDSGGFQCRHLFSQPRWTRITISVIS